MLFEGILWEWNKKWPDVWFPNVEVLDDSWAISLPMARVQKSISSDSSSVRVETEPPASTDPRLDNLLTSCAMPNEFYQTAQAMSKQVLPVPATFLVSVHNSYFINHFKLEHFVSLLSWTIESPLVDVSIFLCFVYPDGRLVGQTFISMG